MATSQKAPCCRPTTTTMAMLLLFLATLATSFRFSQACVDPSTYAYKKIEYRNPAEGGRLYILYDINGPDGCLNDFQTAKAVCARDKLELAPQDDSKSLAAVRQLAISRHVTSWLDGDTSEFGLCYLMSQEGFVHQQGCNQPVRFVCRGAAGTDSALPSPPPSQLSQACVDPFTYAYKKIEYRNPAERGRLYILYDINGPDGCLNDFQTAKAVCARDKLELAPQDDSKSLAAVSQLVRSRRVTSWLDGKTSESAGLCYLMSQEGFVHQQGCNQPVRFVCRGAAARP
ncbi:hypothetical protein Vretifemale_9440 [Volvox reticuliferus]|uniref:Uncharacterized protein n=1 Tax=Volvox reticuliferus TaxID=1737510 RepID=A0A8J4CHI3_9CHLO|nr:hypothetical protein Vretifemale_9440 [Volvox reticuliferus]